MTNVQDAKSEQINAWLIRKNVALRGTTDADIEAVGHRYHEAMAEDEIDAIVEDKRRDGIVVSLHAQANLREFLAKIDTRNAEITKDCANDWHRTAPSRALLLCPECPA